MGRLFAPVDIASLVFFRVAFGLIMLWEVGRYFAYGWVERYYVAPDFRFTYFGFDWLRLWEGEGMYLHFLALGLLAIFIAAGFLYRMSMFLFALGFAYVFLFDQSLYLNHFYLICLVSFAMVFVPAHRAFSVDARLRPGGRSATVPAWALVLIVAHVAIAYLYGGLAKLNGDWLKGEPMGMWLPDARGFPLVGRYFTEDWAAHAFSYGGVLLDLSVVPLLLWRRTRPFAFVFAVAFHLTNANLFQIGIFPFFMIAATLLFFRPSWPRDLVRLLFRRPASPAGINAEGAPASRPWRYAVVGFLGVWLAAQLLVPLRHHLYPGNVSWTEEGHRFSWHMKLRDKEAAGRLVVIDPAGGAVEKVRVRDYGLSREQADDMYTKPDMVLQFAHHVAEGLRGEGRKNAEVRALIVASLNGRDPQLLVDPGVDLAERPRSLEPAGWILPLEEPLDPGGRQARLGRELRSAADEAGWNELFPQRATDHATTPDEKGG